MTAAPSLLIVGVSSSKYAYRSKQVAYSSGILHCRSLDSVPQPSLTTCVAGPLDQGNDVIDIGHHTTHEQPKEMMWSPPVEDAGVSRRTEGTHTIASLQRFMLRYSFTSCFEQFTHTGFAISPFLPTQSGSLPFDGALRPTHAAEYSTQLSSGLGNANVLPWPHGGPVIELHQSASSTGLGIIDLSRPASSCPCVGHSTGLICAHQFHSAVAWVSCSRASVFGFTELTLCT